MPPPPPCIGDWITWLLGLILLGALVAVIVWVLGRLPGAPYHGVSEAPRSESLEDLMKELLSEIRMLRKEIEELRRELSE